jgi:hypothetical protein
MGDGLPTAIRRFPECRRAIEVMIARDEDFRLLCDDLAEAEAAQSLWQNSSSPKRDQILAEYEALVASLAAELKAALGSASVVPFKQVRGQLSHERKKANIPE